VRHHHFARKAEQLAGQRAADQNGAEATHGAVVSTHVARLDISPGPSRTAKVQKKKPFSPEVMLASGNCSRAPNANAPIMMASDDGSVHVTATALPTAQHNAVRQKVPTTMPIDSQHATIMPSIGMAPAAPTSVMVKPLPNSELSGKFHRVTNSSRRSCALPSWEPSLKVDRRSTTTSPNGVSRTASRTATAMPTRIIPARRLVPENKRQNRMLIASESQAVRYSESRSPSAAGSAGSASQGRFEKLIRNSPIAVNVAKLAGEFIVANTRTS